MGHTFGILYPGHSAEDDYLLMERTARRRESPARQNAVLKMARHLPLGRTLRMAGPSGSPGI
jgi:hypothetical protein